MFQEYAVDPEAIGASWEKFRHLIGIFAFDKGRLISEFPPEWFKLVLEVADPLPPVEKKKIEVRLAQARRSRTIPSNRPYNPELGSWLANALEQHRRHPFHAVIAGGNEVGDEGVVLEEELEDTHPLIYIKREDKIARRANVLADAADVLLKNAQFVLLVDRYFDPSDARYRRSLHAYLVRITQGNGRCTNCEVHYAERMRAPPSEAIEREAQHWFRGVIPDGMTVTLVRWRRKNPGEEFHARYILTDKGGLRYDEGLAEGRKGERTDVSIMDDSLVRERVTALDLESTVFELVEPVLQIASNCVVKQI